MRATSLFVLVMLGSIAATAASARLPQTPPVRTFLLRGDIAGGRANGQYFGTFEIAAEPPNRFVQSETRAYFDSEGGRRDRHNTAMGFDGARTIYQPDVPDVPTVPFLVKATKDQEQQIRAAAEAALHRIEPFVNGAHAPFTMTRGGEVWTVRDLQINIDLPDKLFRAR